MVRIMILGAVVAAGLAAPVWAQSANIDLSKPAEVAAALQRAGYKAELKTDSSGDPMISSSANGSGFSVQFYDCNAKKECTSLQFSSWWKKEPLFTPELINEWNSGKRFLKVSIDKDGDLNEYMDVSAVGGVSYEFFADEIDWYVTMDAQLTKFLDAHRPAK